jgi:3-oxoacyl-[acyl-carrier protein] reductase
MKEDRQETVLLLGGSSDLGLEIIRQLADGNPLVLAHYHRSAERLTELQASLRGPRIVPLQADLSSEQDLRHLITAIREQHSLPDKIIHLPAPKMEYVRFRDASWDLVQRNLDVQLRSAYVVLQAFLPEMAQCKRGKVVFVLSSVTLNVPPGALSHYVTAKYALLGLARALAAEYSSKRININAVSPSMVETAFLENLPPRMVEIAAAQSPWQRNATAHDVAAVVRFLLSQEADYLTGANIPITGGSTF